MTSTAKWRLDDQGGSLLLSANLATFSPGIDIGTLPAVLRRGPKHGDPEVNPTTPGTTPADKRPDDARASPEAGILGPRDGLIRRISGALSTISRRILRKPLAVRAANKEFQELAGGVCPNEAALAVMHHFAGFNVKSKELGRITASRAK